MKKISFLALIIAISFVFAAPSFAATWCANMGGTDGCFATVQGAIDMANPGDKVQVWEGTYYENLFVDVDNIIIEGVKAGLVGYGGGGFFRPPMLSTQIADPKNVIIDALNGCVENGSSPLQTPGHVGIYIVGHDVTVRNLTVRHSNCDFNIYSEGMHTVLDKLRVIDGWGGIYIYPFYLDSAQDGMGPGATVTNSLVSANGPGGAIVIREDENVTVTGNKVLNNYNVGVWLRHVYNAVVKNNEVRAVGADPYDIIPMEEAYDPLQEEEAFIHACISASGENIEISYNTISNCSWKGIGLGCISGSQWNITVKNNTIDSALWGITAARLKDSIVKDNTINGGLVGILSTHSWRLTRNIMMSIIYGSILTDIKEITEEAKLEPSENGPPMKTFENNTVENMTVAGYILMHRYMTVADNTADNVPSSLFDALDSFCGFYIWCDYCTVANNYAANSSAGFWLDIYEAMVNNNISQYNSWFGFLIEAYDYNTISSNTAKFNGGSERWTGGFEIWASYSNTINGNTAEKNGNGMSITSEGDNWVEGNSILDNRVQGLSTMGPGPLYLVNNVSRLNECEGIANIGGNIPMMTGNTAQKNRTDICNDGGTMPDPPVGNTYDTYNPTDCIVCTAPVVP